MNECMKILFREVERAEDYLFHAKRTGDLDLQMLYFSEIQLLKRILRELSEEYNG